jgi:hypothetical protein
MKDLEKMTMEELHGILVTYEMRIEQDNPTRASIIESIFNASKKKKMKECKTSDCLDSKLDEQEANFVRKLKSRYKGNIPFKFFSCGKTRHFSYKFPYARNGNINVKEDSSFKKYNEGKTAKKKKFCKLKKNLYTNEDNKCLDDSDSEMDEIIFMGLETQANGNIVST